MSKEWYQISPPRLFNGGFERQEFEDYAQAGFDELLLTSPLSDTVTLCDSRFENNLDITVIMQSVTENSILKTLERQILAPINTLQDYSYVKFAGDIWLICSEPTNNKMYEKAILKLCTGNLRWQDLKTGAIFEYPCFIEDATKYSSGIEDGKVMSILEKQLAVKLPLDDVTKAFSYGQRFLPDKIGQTPLAYQLSKFDSIIERFQHIHILNLILKQCEYNPNTDNAELMIADYQDVTAPPTNNISISYLGKPVLKYGGSAKKFTMTGNSLNETLAWTVPPEVETVEIKDDFIRIKLYADQKIAGDEFRLSLQNDQGNTVTYIDIKAVNL